MGDKNWVQYHCLPEPKGPPANKLKRGIILAAEVHNSKYASQIEAFRCEYLVKANQIQLTNCSRKFSKIINWNKSKHERQLLFWEVIFQIHLEPMDKSDQMNTLNKII